MVAILDGQVLAAIPLPIAGLMSDKPAAEVDAAMDDLYDKARRILGVSADVDVIMTLCFMSLPVIPKLKLLDTDYSTSRLLILSRLNCPETK